MFTLSVRLVDDRKMKALEDRIAVLERELKDERHHYRMRYEERLYQVANDFEKYLERRDAIAMKIER